MTKIVSKFNLTNGFLPATDPLQQLSKYFIELELMCRELPKLLTGGQLRNAIAKMSEINIDRLSSELEYERAMLLLSFLGHAYVWGQLPVVDHIPKQLALSWVRVAKKLDRPPILSYASYALHNWRRLDPTRPIELGNIVLLQNFLGGIDEEWFVLVHVDIEAKAGPAVAAALVAQQAVIGQQPQAVAKALRDIGVALKKINATMERMPERCDPYIYYHRVRPYIHGWKNNPALPEGLLYEGVEDYQKKPVKFLGETGAQSSIIPSLDAALGVYHRDDPLRVYLQEMRIYMPAAHRAFIEKLEQGPKVREFIIKNYKQFPDLREQYNECIKLITRFRDTHLHYAAQYIQKQSQTSAANPTAVGTGGTPFMKYLSKHKEETDEGLIP